MTSCAIIQSKTGSQKYIVPVSQFIQLQWPIGSPVQVTTNDGVFLCKIYPNHRLKNDVIVENSVQLFGKRQKFVLKHPLPGGKLNAFRLQPNPAIKVRVTVVAKDHQAVTQLAHCKLSAFVRNLLSNRLVAPLSCLNVESFFPEGSIAQILILDSSPECQSFTVNSKTQIIVQRILTKKWLTVQQASKYQKLGGLDRIYGELKELVVNPQSHGHIFHQLNVPRGVLLHGPPGCGKSAIVNQLCHENDLFLLPVTCSDVSSSDPGGSESKLAAIFNECRTMKTAVVIFLDEIDSICPQKKRNANQNHTNRLATCLTGLIDQLASSNHSQVVVIGATNRLEDVDSCLRRPGRLDREIFIGAPDCGQRKDILQSVCRELDMETLVDDFVMDQVAEMTPGYVGADLNLLCREAIYLSAPDVDGFATKLTIKEWKTAIGRVRPSMMRSGNTGNGEFRRVDWDQVGGLEEAKMYIRRSVEWPLRHPDAFVRLNVPRPKGVLVYGPPGCGKSMLVRAAATSCAASFFSISAAELFSPFVGDSEKMVADLFRRARQAVPSIVFLDELDAMVGSRTAAGNHGRTAQLGVVATLLQEMDGISSGQSGSCAAAGVVVVGATNRPDKIDAALLRPGRFDALVHIPHPDKRGRLDVLTSLCRRMPLSQDVDLDWLAGKTDLYSGADLDSLTKEAALVALEEDLSARHLQLTHFQKALLLVAPSLTSQQIKFYEDYAAGKGPKAG